MNTSASNKPAARKRIRLILSGTALLLLVFAFICIARNFSVIKNAVLRQILSPAAYLTYVEKDYISGQSDLFEQRLAKAQAQLSDKALTGADISLKTSKLISGYLKDYLPFQSASLSLRHDATPDSLTLTGLLQTDGEPYLSLALWSDTKNKQCYIQLPELSGGILSCPYSEDFLPARLIQETANFLQSCLLTLYNQVQTDPYAYLRPYLDIIEEVTMTGDVPLPIEEGTQTALCMTASISVQRAMEIASVQLEDMDEYSFLLPVYHLVSELFKEWSNTYDLSILITAYIDEAGQVLGHEFALDCNEETLISLRGLLQPDPSEGQSGTLYLTFPVSAALEPYTLALELEQIGISDDTGLPYGTVLFPVPGISAVSASLELFEKNGLPEAELKLHALGFSAASVLFRLSTEVMPMPEFPADAAIYAPEHWNAYFDSLSLKNVH